MRKYCELILIVIVIGLQFVLPALHAEGGNARDELMKNGIEYSEDSFVKCAGNGDLENVKLFLAEGMEINAKNNYGETALMAGAVSSKTYIVRVMLEKGADIKSRNKFGNTPLSYATEAGNAEIIKILKEAGATE